MPVESKLVHIYGDNAHDEKKKKKKKKKYNVPVHDGGKKCLQLHVHMFMFKRNMRIEK